MLCGCLQAKAAIPGLRRYNCYTQYNSNNEVVQQQYAEIKSIPRIYTNVNFGHLQVAVTIALTCVQGYTSELVRMRTTG